MTSSKEEFSISLRYKGKSVIVDHLTTATTGPELHTKALQALGLSPEETTLKLLFQGKRIPDEAGTAAFSKAPSSKKIPKILVIASAQTSVQALNAKKQDPTIRGFEHDNAGPNSKNTNQKNSFWGDLSKPKKYKFGRLKECNFHSFGHRPTDSTPHAFAARRLLEQMSTDPGIIALLEERELTVNTLGEMDPIDDRLMQKKQQQSPGSCLLGYNTNHGLRIDVKLRTDDLKSFRPYPELISTLIHELSHNWVGEHNLIFWANYGQMRVEYLMAHKRLQSAIIDGKTSAEIAGLGSSILNNILEFVRQELMRDMTQHGLHPDMIADSIRQRYNELQSSSYGQKLGGGESKAGTSSLNSSSGDADVRTLALEAAERRAREQQQQQEKEKGKDEETKK